MKKESQADKLYRLLSDGKPHSTPEILAAVYGINHRGIARIASRAHDLRLRGHEIENWPDKENPSVSWYQLKNAPKPKPRVEFRPVEVNGVMMVRPVEVV